MEAIEDHQFMEEMKLGQAADGYEDPVCKLKVRFDVLPLHRACYFQSYHTLRDSIETMQSVINVDPDACSKVDFLDRWRDELIPGVERVQLADSTSLGTEVASVCHKLAVYERMEALSLLEMAVWRMKVDEVKAALTDSRESCRVHCGGSIMLMNVIPFMDMVQVAAP
ncbi:MAG: hypothetical protein SGBAC_008920 [Bacillariaceae sp.]